MRLLIFLWAAVAFGQRPLEYFLDLRVDPAAPRYEGRVAVEMEFAARVSEFRLHAVELEIRSAVSDGQRAAVETVAEDEQIRLRWPEGVGPGRVRVEIEFAGALSEKSQTGLYRRAQGRDWYAFTMFTAIEARRAFPCFDEPRFKTPWSVTLTVPAALVAAANAPVSREEPREDGWKRVEFARTDPLPTEVVAFTVGPWEVHSGPAVGAKRAPSRVLAARGTPRGQVTAALEAAPEMVRRLEEYVGMPYPWAKLDQVGLLANAFGAVENPGLITYQASLLFPEKPEGVPRMRGVMAHELAHQWFGNLVTQASWEEVWLSEGFATLLGNKMADLDHPETERGKALRESRARMLERDATTRGRAVRVPKSRREEMRDVYAGEVYGKAASILRMIEDWVGDAVFERALRRYLREHEGGTARLEDFARALRAEAGTEVRPVLESFLSQKGVPRVQMRLECPAGGKSRVVAEVAEGWTAPVCVRTAEGRSCAVIAGRGSVELPGSGCPLWVVPNAGGAGYYHTEFNRKMLEGAVLTAGEQRALAP